MTAQGRWTCPDCGVTISDARPAVLNHTLKHAPGGHPARKAGRFCSTPDCRRELVRGDNADLCSRCKNRLRLRRQQPPLALGEAPALPVCQEDLLAALLERELRGETLEDVRRRLEIKPITWRRKLQRLKAKGLL